MSFCNFCFLKKCFLFQLLFSLAFRAATLSSWACASCCFSERTVAHDLAEQLGIRALSNKMNDEDTKVRDALFRRDCAKNTRFAINFFTAIGLGGVTEAARKLIV